MKTGIKNRNIIQSLIFNIIKNMRIKKKWKTKGSRKKK